MPEVICKSCGASDYVRNGTVRGLQRYLCKACQCNFTMTPPRGKSPAVKALATLLYAMGNMSFCGIGRLLGVSDVAVLNWVRDAAASLPEPQIPADVKIVMVDEMHHFLKNQRGLMPPVGVETLLRYLACGRERPSTFWWHVTP